METTTTDCRTEEGVTVGIIDAIITLLRLLKGRDLSPSSVQGALLDLKSDEDLKAALETELE